MKNNLCDYISIGERIRQARKVKNYTQEQVSEMIDMNPKSFSQLERGLMGMSTSTLMALCKTLEVSADYILFGMTKDALSNTFNILLSELDEKEQLYAENLLEVFVNSCKNK